MKGMAEDNKATRHRRHPDTLFGVRDDRRSMRVADEIAQGNVGIYKSEKRCRHSLPGPYEIPVSLPDIPGTPSAIRSRANNAAARERTGLGSQSNRRNTRCHGDEKRAMAPEQSPAELMSNHR